jgi:hypothetical protein
MRALAVAALYFGTFITIGWVVRCLVRKRMGDVELSNVRKQAGPSPRKRFLLGAWRNED